MSQSTSSRETFRDSLAVPSALPDSVQGASGGDTTVVPNDLPEIHRQKKLKVFFVGAHVDDWLLCGGTLARYSELGHDVQIISLTPGNSVSMADVAHMPLDQLAAARRDQAVASSKMVGASIRFLEQNDLLLGTGPEDYQAFNHMLLPGNPDVVFTLWAMEFHPDHRAAGNLAFNAWLQSGTKFGFYFCDNPGGRESPGHSFVPNHYVDVESVKDLKRESWAVNTFIAGGWSDSDLWWKFRGMENGCKYAEAFIRMHTVASMRTRNLYPNWWYYGGLALGED